MRITLPTNRRRRDRRSKLTRRRNLCTRGTSSSMNGTMFRWRGDKTVGSTLNRWSTMLQKTCSDGSRREKFKAFFKFSNIIICSKSISEPQVVPIRRLTKNKSTSCSNRCMPHFVFSFTLILVSSHLFYFNSTSERYQ